MPKTKKKPMQPKRVSLRTGVSLAIIFGIALAIRIVFASRTHVYPNDSYYYMVLGRNLMSHFSYSYLHVAHAKFLPLYPAAIAIFGSVFRNLDATGKFLNVGFYALAVFPIYGIGRRCFGEKAGFLAALLFAVEPITTIWASLPMSEGLFVLLITGSLYFLVRWWADKGAKWLYVSAIVGGLCALVRWEGILLFPIIFIVVVPIIWKKEVQWKVPVLAMAIFLAPILLWSLRNVIVFGNPFQSAYLNEATSGIQDWMGLSWASRLGHYFLFSDVHMSGTGLQTYNLVLVALGYVGLVAMGIRRQTRNQLLLFVPWLLLFGPLHFIWYFTSSRFLVGAVPVLCIATGFLLATLFDLIPAEGRGDFAGIYLKTLSAALAILLVIFSLLVIPGLHSENILLFEITRGGLAAKEAALWALSTKTLSKSWKDSGSPNTSMGLGTEKYRFLIAWFWSRKAWFRATTWSKGSPVSGLVSKGGGICRAARKSSLPASVSASKVLKNTT